MKLARSAIKLIAVLMLTGLRCSEPSASERALIKFYRKHTLGVPSKQLSQVVQLTEKYAAKVCLSSEVDTLLSMAHRESHFKLSVVGDDGKSFGTYQTLTKYEPMLRRFWKSRGVTLPGMDTVETQCAFGVAEFYLKLRHAKGNIKDGIRRYNGSGPRARRYSNKVLVSRALIFNRPHVAGESIAIDCRSSNAK